jgi:cell wall-associated NlpC family hydrolase
MVPLIMLVLLGCYDVERHELVLQQDVIVDTPPVAIPGEVQTGKTSPAELVSYAETLVGTPYLYASSDIRNGFDCSGFITWVFNHFNIKVPRSSVDFTDVGQEIPAEEAQRGDIILFTGTDSTIPRVGHMGIITDNTDGAIQFIHSSSGKAKGVVITPLENYYRSRFVKINRVFPDHFFSR